MRQLKAVCLPKQTAAGPRDPLVGSGRMRRGTAADGILIVMIRFSCKLPAAGAGWIGFNLAAV